MKRTIVAAAISATLFSCGGGAEVETGDASSSGALTLLTLYDEADQPLLDFSWTRERGWHFAAASALSAVGGEQLQSLTSREPLSLGDALSGEGATGGPRFSGAAVRVSGFSGASGASRQFSGANSDAGGFRGGAPRSGGFSGSLSAGYASCSLRGFCEFISLVCEVFGGLGDASGLGECQAAANQCFAEIDTVPIPAQLAPVVCALNDYLECLANAVRTVGLDGDLEFVCASEARALLAAGLELEGLVDVEVDDGPDDFETFGCETSDPDFYDYGSCCVDGTSSDFNSSLCCDPEANPFFDFAPPEDC